MNTTSLSVVVGYDGSADSDLALSWAEETAAQTQRPLHVLISLVDPAHVIDFSDELSVATKARLEPVVRAKLKDSAAPEVLVTVVEAPPSPALIDASQNASLVVVGARGHSLLAGVVLGSVSQHVSAHAACPVIVVRRSEPALDRVVVGVDGSAGSAAALEFAAQHASRTGSKLTVIHAWRSFLRGGGALMGAPFDDHFNDEVALAERILSEAVAGLGENYPDVEVVTEAIPVSASRCLADASATASLLVVGSHGRGVFAGMLLGSTSHSLLHHAQCSVAVVR